MSRIRPSLILRADIDEREYNEELVSTIKRSYAYISGATVKSHAPSGDDAENTLCFDVRLHRAYWDVNDPEAAARWDEIMPKWLHNMFYKVSSTITATNKMSAENHMDPLYYAWTELKFGDNVTISFKTKEDCSLDDSYLPLVEKARRLMCAGELGEGVEVIRMPSRASYEAQKALAIEEQRRRAEAAAAAAEAADEVAQDEAETADEATESAEEGVVELAQAAEIEAAETADIADAEDASVAVAEPEEAAELADGSEPEPEPKPVIEHVNFDPDLTTWGIEYEDGTVREFDSTTGAFLE